jgi:flagellar assembly factor FliW
MSAVSTLTAKFTTPSPGVEGADGLTLRGVDGASGLFVLEASAGMNARLFVADAAVYVPGYAPAIPEQAADAGQITMLLGVNRGSAKPTVYLAAPLVLNAETGTCTQLILDSNVHALRAEHGAS